MAKIVITEPLNDAGMALLKDRPDIEVQVLETSDPVEAAAAFVDADAIAVRAMKITAAMLEGCQRLKVVSRHGVGFDNVDVQALSAMGIPLATVGEANSLTVAEHTFALMLMLAKDLRRYEKATRAGDWNYRVKSTAMDLAGKNLLIAGFGRIGTRVARRAEAFEMNVIVADPNVPRRVVEGQGYRYVADYHDALGEADVFTAHFPATPGAPPAIAEAEFDAMKDGAIFINCARGSLVDEDALAAALKSGKLRGAGIDVFQVEPVDPNHPLFEFDNLAFSPHSAAATAECFQRMASRTVQSAIDAIDGKLDPYYVVNPEIYQNR